MSLSTDTLEYIQNLPDTQKTALRSLINKSKERAAERSTLIDRQTRQCQKRQAYLTTQLDGLTTSLDSAVSDYDSI